MHKLGLPKEVRARIAALRGNRRVFARLEPRSTVLLVIDMQNFFIEVMPAARGIVPNINRLAAALRAAGGRVAWVQATHAESGRGAALDAFRQESQNRRAKRLGRHVRIEMAACGQHQTIH